MYKFTTYVNTTELGEVEVVAYPSRDEWEAVAYLRGRVVAQVLVGVSSPVKAVDKILAKIADGDIYHDNVR